MNKQINWKWIFAHTAMIWTCSYLFGFIVGVSVKSVAPETSILASDLVILLLGSTNLLSFFLVVFVISLVQKITWRHLFLVLILSTILSFTNLTYGYTFSDMFVGAIIAGITIVIGKSLAMLILKTHKVFKIKQTAK